MLVPESCAPRLGYSVKDACRISSLGRTSIYGHIAAGRLKVSRVGRRTIISADSLRILIEGGA
jgi:hypothetical protein